MCQFVGLVDVYERWPSVILAQLHTAERPVPREMLLAERVTRRCGRCKESLPPVAWDGSARPGGLDAGDVVDGAITLHVSSVCWRQAVMLARRAMCAPWEKASPLADAH